MAKRAMFIQKILLFSAIYQILIGLLFYMFPGLILNLMDGMEIFYPYISIPKIPLFKVIGILTMVLAAVQIVYGAIYVLIEKYSWSKLIGYIIGAFMVLYLPTGTLFGLMILMELIRPDNTAQVDVSSVAGKNRLSSRISHYLIVSGLIMLNMPIVLLFLQFILITMPIDMAFPLFPAVFTERWRILSWILICVLIFQIVIGALFNKFADYKWMRWVGFCFGVFQMLSLGIFFQYLLHNLGLQIEAEEFIWIIFNFGGILGVILNPIGLFYGFSTIKGIVQYSKVDVKNSSIE